ncbi:MAG TPA: outer membrane protein transport protein [Minicystis sp.]|nr:outer membrane protein transport protein [Minicystis sp.]
MHKPLALATLVVAAIAPATALASGFETARFGGEHGTPVSPNPTAVYYNPAALAETQGVQVWLEYDLALRSASYEHSPAKTDIPEPPGAQGANDGKGTLFNVVGAPFIGASWKVTKDLALGAAFYVPFGGQETWDQNSKFKNQTMYPGIVDGPQRWYSITGEIISMYWSLGVAYKIPGTGLSLGASGNLIRSDIKTIRAREISGTDSISNEGRSYLDVEGFEGSFAAGALYEFIKDKLWMGASYQARPNVAGGMKLNGTLSVFSFGSDNTQKVSVYQDYPDMVRWGARWRPNDKWELRLFADWERWSNFQDQCISNQNTPCVVEKDGSSTSKGIIQNLPRRWQDGFGIRAGGSYWVKPEIELFLGTGYDSNAVPDQHLEPVIMDMKRITATVGGTFDVTKNVALGLSFTQFFGIPRDTTGESQNAQFSPPSTGPDAGGKYNEQISVFNLDVNLKF